MRTYRCLIVAICSVLFPLFASATEKESKQQFACETVTFFFSLWEDSAFGQNPNGVERAAWILQDDQARIIFQKWRNSGERNKELWKGPTPAKAIGVVHTHSAHRDSRPSPADVTFAKRLSIPVYVISANGLWMSSATGKISRVFGYVRFKEAVKSCNNKEAKNNSGDSESVR
jgi:hypothetical protein